MAELKPCPFDGCTSCGIAVHNGVIYHVYCSFCGTVGSPQTSKKKAIDAWNKRS